MHPLWRVPPVDPAPLTAAQEQAIRQDNTRRLMQPQRRL